MYILFWCFIYAPPLPARMLSEERVTLVMIEIDTTVSKEQKRECARVLVEEVCVTTLRFEEERSRTRCLPWRLAYAGTSRSSFVTR